jgi:hypothetical protein
VTGKRKRYSAEFKAKVALDALRGELATPQLASKHGIHQTMVGEVPFLTSDGELRAIHLKIAANLR